MFQPANIEEVLRLPEPQRGLVLDALTTVSDAMAGLYTELGSLGIGSHEEVMQLATRTLVSIAQSNLAEGESILAAGSVMESEGGTTVRE